MKEQYHNNCLVCNSTELEDLPDYKKYFLCKCKSCNFVFAKKIPSIQELETYYEGYGRNDYLSPITIKRYNELLDKLEKYRDTNNLLDVGCGIGYFLEEAKKRGWNVYGTEYTDEAIAICTAKGIQMKKGKLNPEDFGDLKFDILTSFEVLEHINNPLEELSNFNSLLRKGGIVYATTPNFNSLLRYKLKAEYNVITYPEHLSYYTPKTITKVFKKSGFSKVKIETTGISVTRLKTSQKKSTQAFISKESDDEIIRNKMESSKLLGIAKNIANFSLTTVGKGDSLKVIFKKK